MEACFSLTLLVLRQAAYIWYLYYLGLQEGLLFAGFQLGVLGDYNALAFAPNHKGMPLLSANHGYGFLELQARTARDVNAGHAQPVLHFVLGGLECQIVHHLFPGMPRRNLPKAKALVKARLLERGVPYTEAGVVTSYGLSLGHIGRTARSLTRENFKTAA